MSIAPQSLRFHPLERAIAKIEDVLGAEFGEHVMRVFDQIVPRTSRRRGPCSRRTCRRI
jgi:hypothetical protein